MATMFTGLARVAKKTGFPVEETPGWKTDGHGGMTSCSSIIIHHTAGADNGKDYNSYGTVKNGRPGLPGPLAQLGIGRNTGTVYVFAAGKSWHAGKVGKTAHNNDNAIGIEIENNGVGEKYSDKTYNSAVALAGELVKEFGLKVSDVLGHKEIAVPKGRKIDPSFAMGKFREDVQKYINTGKAPSGSVTPVQKPKPTTPAKPAPKPSSTVSSAVQAKLKGMGYPRQGVAEVKAFQKAHGLWEDGDWAGKTEAKYQENVKLQNALKRMKGVPDNWKSDGFIGATSNKWIKYTITRQGWSRANLISKLKSVGAWK